ncbi:unnamed protein product, partial [Ectocarpus sp. 8 AP-2014]
ARGLAFEIADEPLEAWFEAMHPVWSRQLAARVFRRALLLRRRTTAGGRSSRNGSRAAGAGEDEGADAAAVAAEAAAVEREGDEEDARSYLEHVRDKFGDNGPPPAFPLPGAATATAARKKAAEASRRPGVWGCEGGGIWSPRLVRVRV